MALKMLKLFAKENPSNAVAWYEYACAEDGFGAESCALLAYERVSQIGVDTLPLKEQPSFYLGNWKHAYGLDPFRHPRVPLLKV